MPKAITITVAGTVLQCEIARLPDGRAAFIAPLSTLWALADNALTGINALDNTEDPAEGLAVARALVEGITTHAYQATEARPIALN